MKHYIDQTGAELWIPLFPLLPDYTLLDETEFTVKLHRKMLERFKAENIVWLGFSGGADVLFQAGRHMVQKYPVFTFLKEGREGEQEIIDDIKSYYESLH